MEPTDFVQNLERQGMSFSREAAEAVGASWEAVDKANQVLESLAAGRQSCVCKADYETVLGWRIGGFSQTMVYRCVMLGRATSAEWNSRNVAASVLCARALMETVAVLVDLDEQIGRALDKADLESANALVMNRTFATRLAQDTERNPELKATNIITAVQKLNRRYNLGNHYDRLSEIAHPNHTGHALLYGDLDPQTGTISLSEVHLFDRGMLSHVLPSILLLGFLPEILDRLSGYDARAAQLGAAPAEGYPRS